MTAVLSPLLTQLSWEGSHAQESAEDAPKTALWTGKIKHRLKTADAASVVELFELSALVLEKLLEQMPPTIFVSALAGTVPGTGSQGCCAWPVRHGHRRLPLLAGKTLTE